METDIILEGFLETERVHGVVLCIQLSYRMGSCHQEDRVCQPLLLVLSRCTKKASPRAPLVQGCRWTHSEDKEEACVSCTLSNQDEKRGIRKTAFKSRCAELVPGIVSVFMISSSPLSPPTSSSGPLSSAPHEDSTPDEMTWKVCLHQIN